jgi:hypothetical protein
MVLPSDAAKPSATSNDKINGTQSLQHTFSAYKLSVYALQWLLPDTAQDSIIDVPGQHFRCIHFAANCSAMPLFSYAKGF